MAKTWEECMNEAGAGPKAPPEDDIWYVYSDGMGTPYKSAGDIPKEDRNKAICECTEAYRQAYAQYVIDFSNHKNLAYEIWEKALREDYAGLTDAQFDIVLGYCVGEYRGRDEQANAMIDIAIMAIKLLATKKG